MLRTQLGRRTACMAGGGMQDLRAVRFAETESRIVGARDWGRRRVES